MVAIAQSPNTARNPAIHKDTAGTGAEPAYCKDIAADFCPTIPYKRSFESRKMDQAKKLEASLKKSEDIISQEKIYEHLFSSLKNNGFPLNRNASASDIKSYFGQNHHGYLASGGGIDKIFSIDKTLCREDQITKDHSKKLTEEIALISRHMVPGDNEFDILRLGPSDESTTLSELRKKVQSSKPAKELFEAMGEYNSKDKDSTKKFGDVYANFQSSYASELAKVVAASSEKLNKQKTQFQEFTYLCNLFLDQDKQSLIEENECDVSSFIEISQFDGMVFGEVNPDVKLDQKIISLRRKLWSALEKERSGSRVIAGPQLRDALHKLIQAGVRDDQMFSSFVRTMSESVENVEDVFRQINPLIADGSEVDLKNRILCENREKVYIDSLGQELSRVERVVRRSEAVVRSIQNDTFPKAEMADLKETFEAAVANSSAQFDAMARHIGDAGLVRRFQASFKNIKPYNPWNRSDVFSVDPGTGLKTIDYDKVPSEDYFYNLFVGGNLDELGDMNAYMFDQHMSQLGVHEGLVVLPAFLNSYRENQGAMFFMLNHELAHLMDPNVFLKQGARFPPAWQSVLDCLSQKNSTGAAKHQHGECFADWFATEVLASTLNHRSLDKQQRFNLAQDSMLFLCEQHMSGVGPKNPKSDSRFDQIDVHLTPKKRLNGIIGANPVVREALGCYPTGKEPYCGMSFGGTR
jgi:hypothetical protein